MIDRSFVDRIGELSECRIHEIHGRQYAEKSLTLIPQTIRPDPLCLDTLTGLVDYLHANIDQLKPAELILHIASFAEVRLYSRLSGDDEGRATFIEVKLEDMPAFAFGQWMDQETFIINLQTQFVPTPEREAVLAFVGRLQAERVLNQDDNGVTQTVRLRKGIVLTETANPPSPIELKPYRTFREVEQPASMFVLRLKDGKEGETPRCALFEADGATWRLSAVEAIRDWLKKSISDIAIIA